MMSDDNFVYVERNLMSEIYALRKIKDAAKDLLAQDGYPDCWDFGALEKALVDYERGEVKE